MEMILKIGKVEICWEKAKLDNLDYALAYSLIAFSFVLLEVILYQFVFPVMVNGLSEMALSFLPGVGCIVTFGLLLIRPMIDSIRCCLCLHGFIAFFISVVMFPFTLGGIIGSIIGFLVFYIAYTIIDSDY